MPKIKKLAIALLFSLTGFFSANALADANTSANASVTLTNKNASVTPKITTANAEFVYQYLLAEIAGQRGELKFASQLFLDLAKKTHDPRLAKRAAASAIYARQQRLALQAATLWAELEPSSQEAHQASSQMLIAGGNLNTAKPYLQKWLAREEMRVNGFMSLNRLLSKHQDKQEALELIEALAQPYPQSPEARFAVAQAAWFANKPEMATKALDNADKLRPGWEASAQMQGQILIKESPDKAIAFYKDFLNKYPEANKVRMRYAKLLVHQKRHAEAKPEFIKLVDHANGRPEISAVVGLLSLDANELAMADKYLQQAIDEGFKDPEQLYIYLGRSAERSKNDKTALKWYNKVAPGNRYLEGRVSAANVIARTENLDAAIDMLAKVDNLTSNQQLAIVLSQATMLSQADRNYDAFLLIQKAMSNIPNTVELIYDYAMAAERVGKLDIMESGLRRVIAMKPSYAAAYNALGYSFADRDIKLDEAKTLIETALKLSPNDHYIIDSMGWVEYRLGNYVEAEALLRKAYDMQADPEISAHLGEVLWKQGLRAEAEKIWENALQKFPENDILVSTTEKFKS